MNGSKPLLEHILASCINSSCVIKRTKTLARHKEPEDGFKQQTKLGDQNETKNEAFWFRINCAILALESVLNSPLTIINSSVKIHFEKYIHPKFV